ncbi:MAG: hypothetical protein C4586_05065 [Anaerolineaceae bacterium]|nr:MAG: hypothetical protein C4586_05065 [Anaerolineaceae bacterium]
MKRIAIHQPNYIPWTGYFYKMTMVDVFVILDTAQFTKNGYQNRAMIKSPTGAQWLTQPVKLAEGAFRPTNEISFAGDRWRMKHIETIRMNYGRAKFFKDYFDEFAYLIETSGENLSRLNIDLIKWISDILDLKCTITLASDFPTTLVSTERLIEIVKSVGGDVYLSGKGGENYQDHKLFEKSGIELQVVKFVSSPYPQLWGEYLPGLSVIDLIFNCGKESATYLLNSNGAQ